MKLAEITGLRKVAHHVQDQKYPSPLPPARGWEHSTWIIRALRIMDALIKALEVQQAASRQRRP